jgi:hypothetical protein
MTEDQEIAEHCENLGILERLEELEKNPTEAEDWRAIYFGERE